MNQQAYERAKQAYQQGNIPEAIASLTAAKNPGELCGQVDHLLGNCYMKMSQFERAAFAYGDALRDSSYGHVGSVACNRGRAFLAAHKPQDAIASLTCALKDETYKTPYKAYMALGSAYMSLNNTRDAGVAYRSAAIDAANPKPAEALKHLGRCFILLGRAVDAIEAYRTALDFATPLADQHAIYADLGLAYIAANRMSEAVDAFNHAVKDGNFTLSQEQQKAFDAARKALSNATGSGPSETDALLAAAGYGSSSMVDPLDPTGKSGAFMPSPEDTGFFSIKEEDLVQQDKEQRKVRRKKHHGGLIAFLVIVLIVLLAAGGVCFAFYKGYGWPTQETITKELFSSVSQGKSTAPLLSSQVSMATKQSIESLLPRDGATVDIKGIDRDMNSSTIYATATLSKGGKQDYTISFVREGIEWKVSDVTVEYASKTSTSSTLS